MEKQKLELTAEVIRGLKPYERTAFNAHDTEDDIFRLGQIEGRNQILYLLLALGDENVAHDNWHPAQARTLVKARQEIVKRLRHRQYWPGEWPDFEAYTFCPG